MDSDDLFESAFRHAGIGMSLVGPAGGFLRVNRALCELLGYPEEELLRQDFQTITHPEDLASELAEFDRLSRGEIDSYRREKRFRCRDGEWIRVRLDCSAVRDGDGGLRFCIGQVQDLSEQHRREEALRREHGFAQALVHSLADMEEGSLVVENRRLIQVNPALCRLTGYSEAELLALPSFLEIIHPDERDRIMRRHLRRLRGERFETRYESALLHRSGRRVDVDFAASLLALPERTQIVVLVRDITARLQAQRQLQEANEALRQSEVRLRTITDNVPSLIGYVDQERRYRFNNHAYRDWFGDADALYGRSIREVLGEELYARVEPYVARALAGEKVSLDVGVDLQGETRYLHTVYSPDVTADGRVLGFYVVSHDVTERKQLETYLQHRAMHDPLTGLPNRTALMERMEQAIARAQRNDKPLAVMFLDLCRFKQINDSYGHDAGDQLLREFAARLSVCIRKTDTAARLAGDEFVVLLEGVAQGAADAPALARKILAAMEEPFVLAGQPVKAATSIGIATYAGGEVSAEALLRRADAAMYRAKRRGANRYAVAT